MPFKLISRLEEKNNKEVGDYKTKLEGDEKSITNADILFQMYLEFRNKIMESSSSIKIYETKGIICGLKLSEKYINIGKNNIKKEVNEEKIEVQVGKKVISELDNVWKDIKNTEIKSKESELDKIIGKVDAYFESASICLDKIKILIDKYNRYKRIEEENASNAR